MMGLTMCRLETPAWKAPLHLDPPDLSRHRCDRNWDSGAGGRQDDSGGQSQRRKAAAERYTSCWWWWRWWWWWRKHYITCMSQCVCARVCVLIEVPRRWCIAANIVIPKNNGRSRSSPKESVIIQYILESCFSFNFPTRFIFCSLYDVTLLLTLLSS